MYSEFTSRHFLVAVAAPLVAAAATNAAREAFDRAAAESGLDDDLGLPEHGPLRLRDGRTLFALAPGAGRSPAYDHAHAAAADAAIEVLDAGAARWAAADVVTLRAMGTLGPGVRAALVEVYARFDDAGLAALSGHQRAGLASGSVPLLRSVPRPGAEVMSVISALLLVGQSRDDLVGIVEAIADAYPENVEAVLLADNFVTIERLVVAGVPF